MSFQESSYRKDNNIEYFDEENEENTNKAITQQIRLGFIKKVYGIIFFQVLLTTLTVIFTLFNQKFQYFLISHYIIFGYVTPILAMIIGLVLICSNSVSRKIPINYILLFTFTMFESLSVAMISSLYEKDSVFRIACLTLALVLALSVYAWKTNTDFSVCGATLCMISFGMIIVGIFVWIFHFELLATIYNFFECLLFCFYLIYDTQLVIGNKTNLIKTDDYINGALQIYIDIITIFLKLLQLFGKKKK